MRSHNCGKGKSIPPPYEFVEIYFIQKGKSLEMAREFFNHFERRQWKNKNQETITNWKGTAWEWIWSR
ncbi:hypothetical protein [Pedobacter sp. ASV28]|uniref:hypothetical protein n=1 Tax=Pedobacter sp. ASV28 TaxID=2795123 RepID=UPI0018EDFD97|nr:hypothetical protein [Pedobacter sp. ASV28]